MAEDNSKSLQEEQKLVKLYMDLTGMNECSARGVFMMVEPQAEQQPSQSAPSPAPEKQD
jgi:hypothetical protein